MRIFRWSQLQEGACIACDRGAAISVGGLTVLTGDMLFSSIRCLPLRALLWPIGRGAPG